MKVAITGGTGTLGRALISRLLQEDTERVVSVSRDEVKAGELSSAYPERSNLRVFLGCVRDRDRLVRAFAGCDTVIHAAALKRVGTGAADSIEEMIKTNIGGTINVIWAAQQAGCEKVLFISSDKAVQATNLYGSTKFAAECYAIQANCYTYPAGLRVACTRYGNVLGSRGSVTEVWKSLDSTLPLPISDETMTRFLITQRQAVDLIFYALAHMKGGEIFIPTLHAFTIGDLARAIWPGREIAHTGPRAGGEKMHEVLVSSSEWGSIFWSDEHAVIHPSVHSWTQGFPVRELIDQVDYGHLFTSYSAPQLSVKAIREIYHDNG